MSAIDVVLKAAEARGPVTRVGKEYRTNCPAHADKHPSCDFHEEDGTVVVKCRSNKCTFKDIAAGWGLKESEFYPPKAEPARKGRGPLVAEYLYETILGKYAFKACRHQWPGSADKEFLLFRPDGNGKWIAGIKGVERIPYRLPELTKANPHETVFVLEGEKCVDLARTKLGIVTTTSFGGSDNSAQWKTPAFQKAVNDRNIALIPDHDEPGEKYVAAVAQSIVGTAKTVKIVRLPLKNKGDDIEQWIAAGGTREHLFALVEAAPLYSAKTATPAEPEEPETITLSTVEPRRIDWLWFGRLPSGEMVVITGRPGVGKGLLLGYIVARYTTGRPMHGDRVALPAGHVLWISMEDAHDTSLAPRLIAAGGDRSRVHAWNLNRPVSLPVDADRIIAQVKRFGCTLVIIDPAPTLLDKDHSSNNDAAVRQSFAQLSSACREFGCTLILVRHTNKRTIGDAMDRGGGSIGWSGMARIELMLGRRPVEEGATVADTHESVVTLATVKNNLGKWAPSLNMAIVEAGDSARIEVIGETTTRADDLCAPEKPRMARKTGDAETLIKRILADGEWHRSTEIETAMEDAEISLTTLKRAKKSLGVESAKPGAVWLCRLTQERQQGNAETHGPHEPVAVCDTLHSSNINYLENQECQEDQESHTHPGETLPGGPGAEVEEWT